MSRHSLAHTPHVPSFQYNLYNGKIQNAGRTSPELMIYFNVFFVRADQPWVLSWVRPHRQTMNTATRGEKVG